MVYGARPTATKYDNPNTDLEGVPKKKRGRPTLLPTEIDHKVIEMVIKMRESGAVINYNILVAVATGIVTANDRTLLKKYGGKIEFSSKWCESIVKRLGYVKRKSTTAKPIIAPGLISEIGLTFYKDINEIVQAHEIPAEMIINIDQTPLPFVLISKYTLAEKGASRVSVPGTSDYRQITGTFGVTMAGDFLPIQLIYQGKTKLCQPKFNFPKEFHITQTPNHWANEETSIEMLNQILIPYIESKRKELNLESYSYPMFSKVNGQTQ